MIRTFIIVAMLLTERVMAEQYRIEANDPAAEAASFEQEFGFSQWPGKTGALKKGLSWRLTELPETTGATVTAGEYTYHALGDWVIRSYSIERVGKVNVTVAVAGNMRNAIPHKLMLRELLTSSAALNIYSRGDLNGINIGDLNYVTADGQFIFFTRNNIMIAVRTLVGGINVQALAKQIDDSIKALPDLTQEQFDALRPMISEFRPLFPSIYIQPDGPIRQGEGRADETPLAISVHDPRNESVKTFLDAPNGGIERFVAGPNAVRSSDRAGLFPLSLRAVNDSLQLSIATTNVRVLDQFAPPDTTPPAIVLPLGGAGAEATGPNGAIVSFTVTATDNETLNPTVVFSHLSGSVFPLGMTPVEISATDEAGNVARATLFVTVADTTPPLLAAPANITAEATSAAGAAVAFPPASATDLVSAAPLIGYSQASGSVFPLGPTPVEVVAFDDIGNASNAIFYITVVDTTPPTLTLTANITAEAASPTGANVNFPAATAIDLVTPTPAISYSQNSGTLFPVGVTTVNVTAADAVGNARQGAFTITVNAATAGETALKSANP